MFKLAFGMFGVVCCAIFGWLILPTYPLPAVCIWAGAFLGMFCIFDNVVGGIESWLSYRYEVRVLKRSGTLGQPDVVVALYSEPQYACGRAEREYRDAPTTVFYAEIRRVHMWRRELFWTYSLKLDHECQYFEREIVHRPLIVPVDAQHPRIVRA